jgi:zinc transport system substrate-binding protein
MKGRISYPVLAFFLILIALGLFACHKKEDPSASGKVKVIATLFPLYDFARNVGGESASVTLLVPPGVEPHTFEPKPGDVLKINSADIFIYTGKNMEPWVESLLKGVDNKKLVVVDASRDIALLEGPGHKEGGDGHDGHEGHGRLDPHIWLDFERAGKMVDNIRDGFMTKDPSRKDFYRANAARFNAALAGLDERFKTGLAQCDHRMFVHGGHFAFNYMAKRYNLTYVSAYEGSPNAEPTPRRIMELKKLVKENHITSIYYEELITPRVAELLATETGTTLLPLHGAHNISRDDLEKGITFTAIMEGNLVNLKKGLGCR